MQTCIGKPTPSFDIEYDLRNVAFSWGVSFSFSVGLIVNFFFIALSECKDPVDRHRVGGRRDSPRCGVLVLVLVPQASSQIS